MNRFDSLKGHSYFINNCWLKVELHLRKQLPPCLRERLLKVETIRNGKVFEGGLFLPTLQLKKAETQRGWVSCQGHQVAAGSRIKLIREAYKIRPSTWYCAEKILTWPDLKFWDLKLLIPALMTQHSGGYFSYSNLFWCYHIIIIILCSWCYPLHSFDPRHNPVRCAGPILLFLFYIWGNWVSERLGSLSKITW